MPCEVPSPEVPSPEVPSPGFWFLVSGFKGFREPQSHPRILETLVSTGGSWGVPGPAGPSCPAAQLPSKPRDTLPGPAGQLPSCPAAQLPSCPAGPGTPSWGRLGSWAAAKLPSCPAAQQAQGHPIPSFQMPDFSSLSDVRFEISDLRLQISDVRFHISYFRVQICDFRFHIPSFGLQI